MIMNRLTSRAMSLGLVAVGAVTGLALAGQQWWIVAGPQVRSVISGRDVTAGLAQLLPLATLAAALLALVVRGVPGLRVVAACGAALSASMIILGLINPAPDAATVATALRQVSLSDDAAPQRTGWPVGYAVGGGLALVGNVIMIGWCGRWQRGTDRYRRPGAAGRQDPVPPDDPSTWWRDLDEGVDPTASAANPATEGPISETPTQAQQWHDEPRPPRNARD